MGNLQFKKTKSKGEINSQEITETNENNENSNEVNLKLNYPLSDAYIPFLLHLYPIKIIETTHLDDEVSLHTRDCSYSGVCDVILQLLRQSNSDLVIDDIKTMEFAISPPILPVINIIKGVE